MTTKKPSEDRPKKESEEESYGDRFQKRKSSKHTGEETAKRAFQRQEEGGERGRYQVGVMSQQNSGSVR